MSKTGIISESLSNILHKILSKKIYLVILILIIFSASAYAVIYINWSIRLTGKLPDVRFYSWKDHSRVTELSLNYDIYPDAWVRVKNISYGLENAADKPRNVTLAIQGISDTSKVADLKIIVKDSNGSAVAILEWKTGMSLNASRVNIVLLPNKIYTIEIWVRGSSELKVNDQLTISLLIIVYE